MLQYAVLWVASIACWAATSSIAAGAAVAAVGSWLWPRNWAGWAVKGRRVLITGGAGGLGSALAREVLAGGGRIVLWDINEAKLARVAASLAPADAVEATAVDVTDVAAVRRAVAATCRTGGIDLVFANAGTVGKKRFLDMPRTTLDTTLSTNVKSVLFFLQAVRPHLTKDARICVVSSAVGAVGSIAGLTDYCASKWALTAVVEYLKRSIDVPITTLSPSFMTTDMFNGVAFTPLQQRLTPPVHPDVVAAEALDAVAHGRSHVFLPLIFWAVRLAAAVLPAATVDTLADLYGIHNAADPILQ